MLRPLPRPLSIALLGLTCFLGQNSSGEVVLPGVATSQLEPELRGRVLIEEMGCVSCHQSEALASSSRKAPRLTAVGGRVNPDYLQAFIAAPHQVKPGTAMPDVLANLGDKEKKDVAVAISHYLVSLHKGEPFNLAAPDAIAAEQGEQLFHSVGCVACHAPRNPAGVELLPDSSVPLGALEKKYSYKSLTEFLRRPHSVRPSGRMPDLRLPGHEIERISHYLLRKTEVPGHLHFTAWGGKVWEGLKGDVQKEKAGQVADFTLEKVGRVHHQMAVRYRGYLRIEKAGEYTFHLELNGGNLSLHDKEIIVAEPSNRRGPKKHKGNASLTKGWNKIELVYFHTGREPRLKVEMEGPGFARRSIPSSLLATSDQPVPVLTPLKPDPVLVATGKKHFESLGCAQCHDDLGAPKRDYTELAKLDPNKGCLADDTKTPRFDLSTRQRKLIAAALPKVHATELNDLQMVNKTLTTFNCIACHDRKDLGGISPERNAYFTGTREALGNQGRLPPPLTHVGAKLTKPWLGEVLLNGGRQRTYLNTRMPIFGEGNVGHLIERFAKVDSLEKVTFPEISNIRESKEAGYDMMGTSGFSCIACHDFNGQKAGGAGALELIHVTERLQKNWFHLYMLAPSRFHPTVIMPSYWPGGQSIRKEVLGGDTNQQIEAIWNYLSDGARAKSPKGLSRQSPELRVADETVMCRGRGTAGYRGIGVGYPERISLAFDSEEMALRLIWKGEFASVNHGSFRARGNERITFPAGTPFHRPASMDAPWPYKGKTNYLFPHDHGYQYRGYTLDKAKRPTFLYHYGDIVVSDYFEDVLDENGKAYFKRKMTFETPAAQERFFFRVGSAKNIKEADKEWQLDRLNLRLPAKLNATVRDGDPQDLLIPLTLPKGNTELNLEYRW